MLSSRAETFVVMEGRNQVKVLVKVLGEMLGCIHNENQLAEVSLGRNLSFHRRQPLTAEVGIQQHQAIGKIDHKKVIEQYHCDDSYY